MSNPDISDANYLLGAMVQSGAALIAIVGGILGSRFVAMHGEKRGLARELEETASDLAALNQKKATAEMYHSLYRAHRFVLFPDILRMATEPKGVSSALQLADAEFVHDPKAAKEARRLIQRYADFAKQLSQGVALSDTLAAVGNQYDWATARLRIVNVGAEEHVRAQVYYNFVVNAVGANWATNNFCVGVLDDLREVREAELAKIENQLETAHREIVETEASERRLGESRRRLTVALAKVTDGEGFKIALKVLAVIAVLTVVAPLIAMLPGVYVIAPGIKIAFVIAFLVGLAVLGRYLWVYSAFLTDRLPKMPDSVWGLGRPLPKRKPQVNEAEEACTGLGE
ncbi:hypothetical protein [Demequina zhanjiangensis]|uniref:Uncharacterized protein n=1 Tax=Demequina zhanjiangensis TaxID=3051659 RepID=A0ABT8G3K5_9MICO|nr:hypothetical protein [Demequina sp. SYSU T00b26]MDN4473720.1 hypothetical protein [Demequina sp. SYSU T00b26]